MELKIKPIEPQQPIVWNYDEIKSEVAAAVDKYQHIVYSDNEIQYAKKDRAALNKFVKALEDRRKEIKKQVLEPYGEFEKQVKDIVAIVNKSTQAIDAQVKEYEQQQAAEKLQQIETLWDAASKPAIDWLELDDVMLMHAKWLNASCSIKTIEKEMAAELERIKNDMLVINGLPAGEETIAQIEYSKSLDISKALLAAQAYSKAIHNKTQANDDAAQWIKFEARLTAAQAQGLKEFFAISGIEYRAI